jgi:hypothetical protein
MKKMEMMSKIAFLALILFLFSPSVMAQTCSPFMGIGAVQFLTNTGSPLTSGALYSFQAGTSTQQATFSDSACTVQNVNPITFTTGGRVTIWLTTGNTYKFQLCSSSTDGPACAAGDILASVDNVPGGVSGGSGGGGAPFISTSANPATTGVLRCASGDQCEVYRNAANSGNLAWTKDSNDLLSWAGGSFKEPEVAAPTGVSGFDIAYADSTAHRWKLCNNGASCANAVISGNDISTSDGVTGLHFGATQETLGSTAPTTGQCVQWNGTNLVGASNCGNAEFTLVGQTYSTLSNGQGICTATVVTCSTVILPRTHTVVRFDVTVTQAPLGCTTAPVFGIKDLTSSTVLTSVTISNGISTGLVDSGAVSVATTAGDTFTVGLTTSPAGCTTAAIIGVPIAVIQ